jgi:8-oxo-dGTP pyrophosphatase MutT (NUDIX family)
MGKVILAAGGVVQDPKGFIAIVYRKTQNDWSLPKGKLDQGETFEAAAVREIYEETGVLVTPRHFIGHSAYTLKDGKQEGRKKVVYYFATDFVDQTDRKLAKDVARVEWHHPEDVYKVLTHKKDHRIMDAFFYGPASNG